MVLSSAEPVAVTVVVAVSAVVEALVTLTLAASISLMGTLALGLVA
jgi:hypothetical protein